MVAIHKVVDVFYCYSHTVYLLEPQGLMIMSLSMLCKWDYIWNSRAIPPFNLAFV